MKHTIKFSAVTSALAVLGMLAFSGQAMADKLDTISASVSFPSDGQTLRIDLTAGTTNLNNTYAGLASGAENSPNWNFQPGADGTFRAWCLEPQEYLQTGYRDYDVNTLEQSPVEGSGNPMGNLASLASQATRADDMRLLFGGVYDFASGTFSNISNNALTSQQLRTAFQLAVWEIANETTGQYEVGSVTGTKGYFYVRDIRNTTDDNAIIAQANTWLTKLSTYTAANGLYGLVRNDTGQWGQDYIVQVVPIPAAAWLFGSALLGMAGIGYRRSGAPRSV